MRTPTSISLSAEEYALLDARARLSRTSRSAIIRRAILVATSPVGSAVGAREELSQLRALLGETAAGIAMLAQECIHARTTLTEIAARLTALGASSAQRESISDIDAASAEED